MISSVGRTAADSCASIRAGITRARELDYFSSVDPDTQEPVPVIGHPIEAYSEGFYLIGAWLRIAEGCLDDLVRRFGLVRDPEFWGRTALVGVAPCIDDERFMGEGDELPEYINAPYLHPIANKLGIPVGDKTIYPVCQGNTGMACAIQLANGLLEQQQLDRVLVLAVDSFLDVGSLEWLGGYDRLKCGDTPSGVMPGEAGVCVLFENPEASSRRGAAALASIKSVAFAKEDKSADSNRITWGLGLKTVITDVIEETRTGTPFTGDIIADQSGETWRAIQYSNALVGSNGRVSDAARLILPAMSIGDVGAASGAVAVCVATAGFERGYAKLGPALVVSTSDRGDVAAWSVTHSNQGRGV